MVSISLWTPERRAFQSIADHVPVLMWMSSATGYCFYLNDAWKAFTGQSADEGLGAGWVKVLHPEDQLLAFDTYAHACTSALPYKLEYRLRHRDGSFHNVTAAASPRFDDRGELEIYVGAIAFVVEPKRMSDQNPQLSPRERDVLKLTAAGKTASETAHELGIRERTVNHYITSSMRKLDASNRVHAVVQAIRAGEIQI